jgi:predicted Zn-dependent protease
MMKPRHPLWIRALELGRPAVAVALCVSLAAQPGPAVAEGKGPTLIRDTEIEQLMRDYLEPIAKAAALRTGSVKVVLIGERPFNAFVADGKHIFMNTGALIDAKTPNEIIGVLAHESGHIAGGHLIRLRDELKNAQILAAAAMVLGGVAAIGGSRAGVGAAGTGGMGVAAGGQEVARRAMLSYQRTEEQAADRAAVRYLEATQQSPQGLLTLFKRFNEDAMFKTASIDPYLQSHPLPQERMSNLATLVQQSPYRDKKDSPALVQRHEMARAKLYGFMERPTTVLTKYPLSDRSAPARYARAISAFKNARSQEGLSGIDDLLREQPNNAYFWELKGQMLLETGKAKESLEPLRKAVSLAPNAGLIRAMLGKALVATGNPALNDEALRELANAAQREPDSAEAYRDLATVYARKGNIGMAELSAAQSFFNSGQWSEAASQATRAMSRLPKGSPGWIKAEDIVNYRPPRPNT